MWFKQTEPKSPQQPEAVAPRSQVAPAPSAAPVPFPDPGSAFAPVAQVAPASAAGASRITQGLSFKGEVSAREDLWIGGNVDGTLRFDGARVVVGASGKVHGEIEAREIVVEGSVDGDLRAVERLEITASGRVRGDASAPRISLQEGAIFNGMIDVVREGESRSTSPGAASGARTTPAARGPRFQSAKAAGAAAAAASAATAPAGSPSTAAGGSSENRDGDTTPATSVLLRGIGVDAPERSE